MCLWKIHLGRTFPLVLLDLSCFKVKMPIIRNRRVLPATESGRLSRTADVKLGDTLI
ncbi:hypothetical protein KC19_2G158200 [Ceratodon purpureus]|uniref:Uncharacterized protein n=1 Tax=Ceratodon purpureus TaxID=3225 RepID=A0A8T0IW05_CERPU|nr:hypothetical protein KC19_2G158200 [Ceratodon purpureus]